MSEPSPTASVAESYAESAAYYDEIWSPLIRPTGRRLLEALPLDRAGRVLDVGTGTGVLLEDIASLAPGATAVGIDLTFSMLRVARDRRHATVAAMDCRRLGLAGATFDIAVLPFMLHYVAEIDEAMREVARVVRPGGTVGTATWAADEGECAAEQVWEEELQTAGAGPDPIGAPMTVELMDTPEKVDAALTEAGFEPTRIWIDEHAHRWDPQAFVTYLSYGSRRRRLHTLPEAARAEVMGRVRRRLDALDDAGWVYPFSIVLAIAHRP